jgi:putative aminopeptidase FrvX
MSIAKRLIDLTKDLMLIPGLSGYETRVRKRLAEELKALGIASTSDRAGNLIATLKGDDKRPSVMLFAHMDQLGFVVRKIEPNGLIRLERLGGVPERALASQEMLICVGEGRDVPAIIANKSHHATSPDEKYKVLPYAEVYVDAGFGSAAAVRTAGVDVGSPVIYAPRAFEMGEGRLCGTSIDDRGACAVMIEVVRALQSVAVKPTIHLVFSVQEEFNLRGALTAAQVLKPDIAIQLDLILATDTPDMTARGDVALGDGPAMSMFSFHGRGTLNGTIPHPALVKLFDGAARKARINLQRSAHIGALTDSSYVQLVGQGVASIDVGFPCRYTHSSLEVCATDDLVKLAELLVAALPDIGADFSLNRDDYPH